MSYVSSYDRNAPTPTVGQTGWWRGKKGHVDTRPPVIMVGKLFGNADERVAVTEVNWNGEEWWIRTRGPDGEFWNDLSNFHEHWEPD